MLANASLAAANWAFAAANSAWAWANFRLTWAVLLPEELGKDLEAVFWAAAGTAGTTVAVKSLLSLRAAKTPPKVKTLNSDPS